MTKQHNEMVVLNGKWYFLVAGQHITWMSGVGPGNTRELGLSYHLIQPRIPLHYLGLPTS